jgi:CHASE2 domain-containing sensor protein/tRNA A-37 threonylcarbamoyl transferase component Bud32
MKSGFWKTDWFFGLVVALGMLLISSMGFFQGVERRAYDIGLNASSRAPLDRIAVISIDEASVAMLGAWPWSRDTHAKFAAILSEAKAKVVGTTVQFTEAQSDPGFKYITKLLEMTGGGTPSASGGDSSKTTDTQTTDTQSSAAVPVGELGQFVAVLKEAETAVNADRRIAESFSRAGNVFLPMFFSFGDAGGKTDKPLPPYVTASAIPAGQGAGAAIASAVQVPTEAIGQRAAGLGHINAQPDRDGVVRGEPLLLQHLNRIYPSLSLLIAAKALGLAPADIKVIQGEGINLGKLHVATDPKYTMLSFFYPDRDRKPAFQSDSFYDVYSGKIDAAKRYRDKIVLIGGTAASIGGLQATPISPGMPPVLMLANSVSSILQEHYLVAPTWGWMAELAVFLLLAAYLVVLLPRLAPAVGVWATGGALVALTAVHFAILAALGLWIHLAGPAILLIVGHVALSAKRSMSSRGASQKLGTGTAESSRMLGLAYQGQGQLDLAWDRFRLVPLTDHLMDNLYSLAVDFERKSQFDKAQEIYRHMAVHDPRFRDLESKLSNAKQLSETVILGGAANSPKTNTSILAAGASADALTLGRYKVEKELGKGAMGVVYLGRDPKIGRVVAIKTMALAKEFEADELAEVKERFFREAETAGRLAHQNIVTIYDAGEEHDLAFIAMELLKGGDLVPFTKPGALLPMDKAISIVARTADALGYAHKQGVVHRDIKPANIMYHLESDTVKVTDFGIARLTDSSKTKTGMVLGTPSYMSPEQLAGQKIDGRSDLFSLAGSLYQMLCGRLPFEGDSMGKLMFKISSEPPPDILTLNPDVPPQVVDFLARAMDKEPDNRYQTGEAFAAALREAAAGAGPRHAVQEPATNVVDIQL